MKTCNKHDDQKHNGRRHGHGSSWNSVFIYRLVHYSTPLRALCVCVCVCVCACVRACCVCVCVDGVLSRGHRDQNFVDHGLLARKKEGRKHGKGQAAITAWAGIALSLPPSLPPSRPPSLARLLLISLYPYTIRLSVGRSVSLSVCLSRPLAPAPPLSLPASDLHILNPFVNVFNALLDEILMRTDLVQRHLWPMKHFVYRYSLLPCHLPGKLAQPRTCDAVGTLLPIASCALWSM